MIGFIASAVLFIFPGVLILLSQDLFPTTYIMEKIPVIIGVSLAWWIIGFWFLRLIPIPLHIFIYLTLISSAVWGLYKAYRFRYKRAFITGSLGMNVLILLFFAALFVPVLQMATRQIAPTGQDMSMHAYLAKIIYRTDGFPKTMKPVVPVDQFGYYPVGFPVVIADLMNINHLPVHTNALWLTAITYWLFAVSIYSLLRQNFSPVVSAITTLLISWVPHVPNDLIGWGSNPTVLSMDFLILGVAFAGWVKNRWSIFFMFILFYTAFLTHYMLPIGFAYIFLILLPVAGIRGIVRFQKNLRHIPWLLMALAVAPLLWHMRSYSWQISPATKLYVAGLQRADLSAWAGAPGWEIIRASWQFLMTTLTPNMMTLYALACIAMLCVHRQQMRMHLLSMLGLIILIVNSRYWLLPFSSLLYPDRMVLIALLPMSVGIAEGLTIFLAYTYKYFVIHNHRNHLLLHIILIAILGYVFIPGLRISYRRFLTTSSDSVVSSEDLTAFSWMSTHTKPTDVIMNNYYDAGIWIPAIAERSITTYHTNPIDMDLLQKNLRPPTYAYIGHTSLTRLGTDPVQQEIARRADEFVLVYEKGATKIYQLRTPDYR